MTEIVRCATCFVRVSCLDDGDERLKAIRYFCFCRANVYFVAEMLCDIFQKHFSLSLMLSDVTIMRQARQLRTAGAWLCGEAEVQRVDAKQLLNKVAFQSKAEQTTREEVQTCFLFL